MVRALQAGFARLLPLPSQELAKESETYKKHSARQTAEHFAKGRCKWKNYRRI